MGLQHAGKGRGAAAAGGAEGKTQIQPCLGGTFYPLGSFGVTVLTHTPVLCFGCYKGLWCQNDLALSNSKEKTSQDHSSEIQNHRVKQ